MKRKPESPAIQSAERAIGGVLEHLEDETGDEVVDLSLEDVVDTDPTTGRPVVEKAVEIQTRQRPTKRWSK
jgi:hypothetical protein